MILEKIKREIEESELWIGFDVSKKESLAYIEDRKNATTYTKIFKNPKELSEFIGQRKAFILLENTGIYSIPYELLNKYNNIKVYFINGKKISERKIKSKTDRKDALRLLDIIRSFSMIKNKKEIKDKDLPHPQQINIKLLELRILIKEREKIKKNINKMKNNISSLLYLLGIPKKVNGYSLKKLLIKVLQEIEKIENEELKHFIKLKYDTIVKQLIVLEIYKTLIEDYKRKIHSIIKEHKDYEKLKQLGIFEELIEILIATYWDIKRFPNNRKFLSYFKITRKEKSSGSKLGKDKTKQKLTLIKKYIYILLLNMKKIKNEKTKEDLIRAWNYYKNERKLPFPKAFIKFTAWFLKYVYLYLREK
ncbi:MAG: transposase [candidate division WOR-3 bacterium]